MLLLFMIFRGMWHTYYCVDDTGRFRSLPYALSCGTYIVCSMVLCDIMWLLLLQFVLFSAGATA